MLMYILFPVDVYDSPSCWTIIPAGFNSASIFAAYGGKIYKIDHITCKEMVIAYTIHMSTCYSCIVITYLYQDSYLQEKFLSLQSINLHFTSAITPCKVYLAFLMGFVGISSHDNFGLYH